MRELSRLPLLFFLALLVLLPLFFGQLFTAALIKLNLDPSTALLVVIGMFLDNPINISVKHISRKESVPVDPLAVFGLQGWWPMFQRVHQETAIAINMGGCLIPVALALYETAHLAMAGQQAPLGLVVAVVINIGVCYWMAEPVKGVGIAMPGLFPVIMASLSALLLVPDQAPPVTFDRIVLSGINAAYQECAGGQHSYALLPQTTVSSCSVVPQSFRLLFVRSRLTLRDRTQTPNFESMDSGVNLAEHMTMDSNRRWMGHQPRSCA